MWAAIRRYSFVLAGLAPFLAACESDISLPSLSNLPFVEPTTTPPPCPPVRVLQDAEKLARYRDGPGRDITDIVVEAEFRGFIGSCGYEEKDGKFTSVNLLLTLEFDVTRGRAARERVMDLPYFVAIPKFYPKPAGRSDFTIRIRFPPNVDTITAQSEEIEVRLPLRDGARGPETNIFLGFALTAPQLEENRRHREMRIGGG